ncbi:MAG: TolC family protein [Brumimicrobium sp.]|nr:TolC family protein [Brumimicrobium sp.]
MIRSFQISFILCLAIFWAGTDNVSFSQDSLQTLGFDDYMTIVKKNHPLAKSAELKIEIGEAELLKSRGAFDPKAYTDMNQKYFKDDQYYSLLDAGLQIPTWFGIELYSGFEQTGGINLNPERITPDNGLVYAGISVPLGKDLFIDERRNQLKQAKIYREITREDQRILLNKLLYSASNAYWDWFAAARSLSVYTEAVEIARIRFEGVKANALAGDAPFIDTVEALIQYQNRQISLQQAQLEYDNKSALLNVYLWDEKEVPLEISDRIKAPSTEDVLSVIREVSEAERLDSLVGNHPEIVKAKLEVDQLEIQRRWNIEQLKPTLDLKYNALNEPINGNVIEGYTVNNYNWGLTFSMPLFLRKSRGELNKTKVMIQDQKFQIENSTAYIRYTAQAALNTWKNTGQQLEIYTRNVNNTEKLLDGERQKFNVGESSLFLVNSREMSYINAQINYLKLISENQQSFITVKYTLGLLN